MTLRRILIFAVALAAAAPALADKPLRVRPAVYDPNGTGAVFSDWLGFFGERVLVLTKDADTTVNAAAGAVVENLEEGTILDELGFDVWNGGYCGAGAPRFNVTLTDGRVFFFGCFYGTHTAAPKNFTRVRFGDEDAFPQIAGETWPGFGTPGAAVSSIIIVHDEGPSWTVLDNIDINGELIRRGHGHP
jgi:hypothetical protein